MDYGVAPAADAHNANLRAMFSRRPNTTLIHRRGVGSVHEFIAHLEATPAIPKPVGDMVVGTHAGSEGFLYIPLFRGQRGFSDFEAFDASIGAGANSVEIPDTLIAYTTGDPVTHNFHIKGCNVGRDRTDPARIPPSAPFLVKIKEALGDHVNVTAPKHFHGIYPATGLGVFEYMAYEFRIGVRPTRGPRGRLIGFANRAAALTAFQNAGFRYIDGTAVPNADWDPLIPQDITRTDDRSIQAPLGTTIGTRSTMNVRQQFRVQTDRVLWTLRFPQPADIPPDEPGRMAALRNDLSGNAQFQSAHPWPRYERFGFASLNDYVNGYFWTFTVNRRDLVYRGDRFVYTVLIPILNRTTGNIFFNFYPDAGSAIPAVTTGLPESDNRFFGRS